jgi:hypothetical protein
MPHDAKLRSELKAKVLNWAEPLAAHHSKPVGKLVAEVMIGILSSGSLKLSEIARALKEPKRLHHSVKRLSRMLGKHCLWEELETLTLSRLAPQVSEEMVLAIDPGDLNRDGAPKSEQRCRVRDGSEGQIVGGYPLLQVVARDMEKGTTLPLLCRLYSYEEKEFRSENSMILSAMRRIQTMIGSKRLWVIDRGGDRQTLWNAWLSEEDFDVLVRVTDQRHWLRGNRSLSAQQIAREIPARYQGALRRGGTKEIRFGVTRVRLPSHPDRPLSLIVVRHGKREPMVLVSTRAIRGRRQAERLIHSYMDRWACEEGYRFSKQGFGLEQVMARKYKVLRNLVALANTSWALLAEQQNRAEKLIVHSKRQKDRQRHRPRFPFYSLLKGWQRLFSGAVTMLHDRLRSSPPLSPACQLNLPGLVARL